MADVTGATDDAIRKTLGAVETIAPKAWEMAVRAQRLDAIRDLLIEGAVALMLFVGAAVLIFFGVRDFRSGRDVDWIGFFVFGAMVFGLALIPAAMGIGDVIRMLNPEPYAATDLLNRAACK